MSAAETFFTQLYVVIKLPGVQESSIGLRWGNPVNQIPGPGNLVLSVCLHVV